MPIDSDQFAPFAARMRAAALPEEAIVTFAYYYRQLSAGHTGLIPESEIRPVSDLPDTEGFSPALAELGRDQLQKAVLLKLNGGLGTSMGLEGAKSLLRVKGDLTFLDIIALQALHCGVPLVLMNSFNTRGDSLAALQRYPGLMGEIPLDFLQHKIPKVMVEGQGPAKWPADPQLEWCPPGHGDIYTALVTSSMLERLLAAGYVYAFVSNADNLGAVLDPAILGYFVAQELPFMMEVADRTPADRKGGHLAQWEDGRLILRESAQCPAADEGAFQDIHRYKYFNTNNLWLHLPTLSRVMAAQDNILGLPMIRNRKTLDPRDETSPPVYQLETAMGSAIAVFPGAAAVRVPRSRFAPVKTTSDLLAVRSDVYSLTVDYRLVVDPRRRLDAIVVELDPNYYRLIDDLEARFPAGPPSLLDCEVFSVQGDVRFGAGVRAVGRVTIHGPAEGLQVPDGALLDGQPA